MPDTLESELRQHLSALRDRDALKRELDKLRAALDEAALNHAYAQENVSREDADAVMRSTTGCPQKRDAVLRAQAQENMAKIRKSAELPERERFEDKQRAFDTAEAGCRTAWNGLPEKTKTLVGSACPAEPI
jgi:hypothetical protein